MGKQKQNPDPPADPPDPPANPPANPPAPADDKAKRRDEVKGILAELAASGEIFGGPTEPSPGTEGDTPLDLEAAIGRVLDRRAEASRAREKEQERDQTLTELRDKVGKGLGRVRRWFEPASPWGD